MVVMVIVLILAAIVGPSLIGFWSNNRTKAAADTLAGRLADARGAAISQGIPYRLSASPDGRMVRVSPDESEGTAQPAADPSLRPMWQQDTLPKGVVLTPTYTGAESLPDADGWVTLATFLPDGTCREDVSEFELAEPDETPLVVRIRGLTGVWTINPKSAADPTGTGGMVMGAQQ
jgi:Tfp pilus assembly protein FimT